MIFKYIKNAIYSGTSIIYGFQRSVPNISNAMSEALSNIIEKGIAEEVEGKIRISTEKI